MGTAISVVTPNRIKLYLQSSYDDNIVSWAYSSPGYPGNCSRFRTVAEHLFNFCQIVCPFLANMNNYVEQNMCLWQLMFKHTPEFTHTAHGVLLRWKSRKVRIVYGVIIKFTVLLLVASILMDVSCLSAPGKSELHTVLYLPSNSHCHSC